MAKLRSTDDMMKDYLVSTQRQAAEHARDTRIEAEDPGYLAEPSYQRNPYGEQDQLLRDVLLADQGRDIGEHLQDAGAGLLGTLDTIGNTIILGGSVAVDGVDHLVRGDDANWNATTDALDAMNSGREFTNSLQSEKSQAFDRITEYRQSQAIEQAKLEGDGWLGQQGAAFGSAVESYLGDPGQIFTDGVAQIPYLVTGGVAKGVSPLLGRLSQKMSTESAQKLIQMGLVGGMQGTIEGADAAASTYERVMSSTDTFGPGEEAARETAALEAAAKAFGIAGSVSALTGTLASKYDLSPFSASGASALGRSGDNLVKALQEGFQETIESGTGVAAGNYAGNTVLEGKDRVALEQGVGGAAGTGFVVGAGSTVVTNPRSVLDAAVAPLALAGKGFGYMSSRAEARERQGDMAAAVATADSIVASATTPAMAAAMNAGVEPAGGQTTDTPAEQVELPSEIDTRSQVGLFATGMQYLRGKDMNSADAVSAFHVLGSVLAAANNIQAMRDGAAQDAANESLAPEDRTSASKALSQLEGLLDNEQLDKWVADFPMEDIEGELEDLRQNPEAFGSVIAHLAARNPLKMTTKLIDSALESKSLPKAQRDSLLLAQELKVAEAELKVGVAPDSGEVSRSMMQTGFPGAKENDSVAGYISQVTTALDQGDTDSAQIFFNRLVKFSNYEQKRASAYEAAKKTLAADPDSKPVTVTGYATWNKETGKLDKSLPPFVNGSAASQALVKTIRNDADAIAKMVAAVTKRTGLKPLEAAAVASPAPAAKVVAPTVEKPAAAPVTKAEKVDKNDPGNLTDQELDAAISKTRAGLKQDILTKERDRRIADTMAGRSDRVVDKPVQKAAPKPVAAVVAPVEIVIEEPVVSPAVEAIEVVSQEVVIESSRNSISDLQPGYPVPAGASVAEQNDAKNHLSQSFTTSDRPGLLSKLPKLVTDFLSSLGLVGEDVEVGEKVFGFKDRLVSRLQKGIAAKFPKSKRMAMLKGQNFWQETNAHSLYAAVWDEDGIAYNGTVVDVMAWTGVQQLLDMVNPVSWSADKQAAFLATYGDAILPMLQQGWVPLADQVFQVAQKLQTNLELTPDNTVSLEYTEGTMLALAMDTLSTLMGENGDLQVEQVATLDGPLVQWVKVGTDPDLLHAAARAMDGFFPERASTAAGIIATKPEKVNPFYRGSRQKVGKEQRKALLKMSQTEHKLSPMLSKLWAAMPNESIERLFGYKATADKPVSLDEIARDGANKTLIGDLKTVGAHIRALIVYANQQEEETDITAIPSYFEYEMVVNGRAMTKGTSPQSSKPYRELFSTVQATVDPSKDNRGFLMAVAQGFGIKMDKQPVQTSLDQLAAMLLKPEVQRALQAADRFGNGDMSQLDADLAAFEASGIEMSAHGLSAFVHMAAYQKGQPFVSSLSYEIDGLTDGPINLMMLLGLKGSATSMEHWLGLGGLWFGQEKIAVQDKLDQLKDWFNGSKDLYEIIASLASEKNTLQAQKLINSVPKDQQNDTRQMIRAILHLMDITKLSQSDLTALTAKHSRAFTKKPTQAAGYMQGTKSIVNDLANSLTEALSARIDAGEMTDGDWRAVDIMFGNKLVYSLKKKQHFLIKNPAEFEGLKWEGNPLNRAQFKGLVSNLLMYGGSGLAEATLETIGMQRARMGDAVFLVNQHIRYAQETLQAAYKDKQDVEVAAGRLHENQALSKKDEQALIAQVWDSIIPHPLLRNTGGLPSASTTRSGVPMQNVRRVQGALFDRQNLQVSEASFEDPGVSFAALSIMASGDGSMMTGFFANFAGNFLNMFDGIYINPSDIDAVQDAINKEVKQNWEHDYIGSVLKSLKMEDEGFRTWAEAQANEDGTTLLSNMGEAVANLTAQQEQQTTVMKDINSRDHSVSHMAGGNSPHWQAGTVLNSTSVGTTQTDALLDLALDDLGVETNGIRKLSAADVKSLLKDHTFENPVLSGLWKVLAPLIGDNLTLFVSQDRQALAEFYQQSERLDMGLAVDGVSVGDRVYIRAINAETMVHELLHATTKNLTATFFASPGSLTAQQRSAMTNLLALQDQFLELDTESLPPHQAAMAEHVQSIMRGLDQNSAMQEFLAYGLSNYHLQRTLGTTKSTLGKLMESIFNAVKALFGFPSGTQSDSMLAQMFSNFETLTAGTSNVIYPITVETALNAVNPELARSFGDVLTRLEARSATVARSLGARVDARTRMQELDDSGLFPTMTNEQKSAGEYIQAMFAVGLQLNAQDNALLARVVDAVRDQGPAIWGPDVGLAQARFEFFFENTASKHDRAADILAMALVNPEFAEQMNSVVLPQQKIDKSKFNNWLDSTAKLVYEKMDTGLALKTGDTLSDALEVAGFRMRKSLLQSVKRQQNNKSSTYRKVTEKLSEGVQHIGEMAGKTAEARLKLKSNKDWIGSMLTVVAGITNDGYADMLGKLTLSLSNQMEGLIPAREVVQELVGTVSDNFKLIQLKGIAARMVSAIRQTFREQVPVTVKSWFTDLNPEMDELLHKVIGKMAVYSLSQDLKDRLPELLTNPSNAIFDAELVLMNSGDRTKRLLMIKYAKRLGDHMANQGNEALYRNTQAIAGLAVHGGAGVLSAAEMTALENLSTLQALSHLTPTQRRATLALYRENTEGFWKTTALINSFFDFDTQRAGNQTATMNFQKGWIPVEADGRKKLKLFKVAEVRAAERMGWVKVGTFENDPTLVYMATTIGKTPTLSGGAIHAVDFHMNGIHFHSGLPTDPSIQTMITHPKTMKEIQTRILNGEVMPYTALYDAAGDVVGFQRSLDPAVMERHTKTVGRISDAAGIWLGRLHEERVAHGQNQVAADLLRKTWDEGKAEQREKEFVNIRDADKVLGNVWETLPYHTKVQLEKVFADGSKNPPIWIRRDQLNDAVGYHKASVGNFFTGDNRYEKGTNDNVAALARQMFGKGAYKYLVTAEEGWKAIIGSAKDTIIVKSLVVALNNLASNQTQLFMITGNPVWNLRVQSQKHKELVSYLGYQQRIARLTAEGLATSDLKAQARIDTEQAFLKNEMRKLSIYPLIEAGEMPTIAEGLSETEEFSLVGDFTAWAEKQMGKLPPAVTTVVNNLVVSKETSLYKGLDRMVQYGDFVAKATMYEWLTTQDANAKKEALKLYTNDTSKKLTLAAALQQVALKEINDEFVNYARLPGRWRTYGEDMGLLWFYNYKLRIMKMGFRRMRKNPAAFLIGAQAGSMLGLATLVDTMPGMANFAYSTGLDPLFTAHETIIWNQMFN